MTEELAKEHVMKQAKMSRELQELNNMLAKKQDLVQQMTMSEDKMAAIKSEYEVSKLQCDGHEVQNSRLWLKHGTDKFAYHW